MMAKDVVPIEIQPRAIGGEEVNAVDARQLHEWLEVGKYFSDWFRQRVRQYGFVEGVDYVQIASQFCEAKRGGQNRRDFTLSIDMAKELAMVERTERGRQARRYFIECERRARESVATQHDLMERASQMATEFLCNPEGLREILLEYVERDREERIRASVREGMRIHFPPSIVRRLAGPR
jgi:phage anti-repressor protein